MKNKEYFLGLAMVTFPTILVSLSLLNHHNPDWTWLVGIPSWVTGIYLLGKE